MTTSPKPSLVPWVIVAFFVLLAAGNGVTFWIANRNAPILESRDAYQASLDHDRVQAERSASDALGWVASIRSCVPDVPPDRCVIEYVIVDRDGRPPADLRGTVKIFRADGQDTDAEANVVAAGPGRYRADLPLRREGRFTVRARLEGGPAPWIDERRVELFTRPR